MAEVRRTPAECQYQVMMFAVLAQASFPFPPVVSSSPLQERADRQTDRAWGLYLPGWDLRLSSKEKNIAFVDFFEAFPYLQLSLTQSSGLFQEMVLLF